MSNTPFGIQPLGQTGFRFDFNGTIVYIDPYLSNSVQEQESSDLARLVPIPTPPEQIRDADWVLITHDHRDHCDLDTLLPLASASPSCIFVAPPPARDILKGAGITTDRIVTPGNNTSVPLAERLSIETVPSAHPAVETDTSGLWVYLGYIIHHDGVTLYHAGDTALTTEVLEALTAYDHIDVAFLPVNERNFYRERRGIIGNMSVREAFQFAEDINAKTVVPTHWDMFAANQVYREEIELLYQKLSPGFQLDLLDSTSK